MNPKTETSYVIKHQLKYLLLAQRAVGLWPEPENGYEITDWYTYYSALVIIFGTCLSTAFQVTNFFFIYDDLELMTEALYIASTDVMAVIKTVFYVINIKTWKIIFASLDEELFHPKTDLERELIRTPFKRWNFFTISFLTCSIVCLFFWSVYPILDEVGGQRRLPVISWFPYDYADTPYYELTYLFQLIAIYFLAISNILMDSFATGIMTYIYGQCTLLSQHLRELGCEDWEQDFENATRNNCNYANLHEKLANCVKHHNLILKLAQNCNATLHFPAVFQFGNSIFVLCLTMFQLTLVEPFTIQFYSLVFYQCSMSLQVFLYCWFGNEVFMKSVEIAFAVYEGSWIGTPLQFQKDLLFFTCRAQEPIIIKTLGFFRLIIPTFTAILRSSWSYFVVLRQVNDE